MVKLILFVLLLAVNVHAVTPAPPPFSLWSRTAAPPTPASGKYKLWINQTSGTLQLLNSSGVSNDYLLGVNTALSTLTAAQIPAGGNNLQVLQKISNADYQTAWVTLPSGFANPMTTFGDLIAGGTGGAATRLAGNTTSIKQFLTQTGDGTNAGNPVWTTILAADVPTLNQNTTGNASTATTANYATSAGNAGNVTGTVAIANGGTGSTTQNFVDLSSAQTVAGAKTFSTTPTFSAFASTGVVTNTNTGVLTTSATLPIANGGTASAAVLIAPTASRWAGWDTSKNMSANNFIGALTTTATAAGTTTLLVGSNKYNVYTGTSTQTVVLPVATTLANGTQFYFLNNSTGAVTVQTSGAVTLQAMAANTELVATLINSAGGTGTASWSWEYLSQNTGLPMTNPMTTSGDIIYGGTSGAPTRLPIGSSGQVLTVASGVPSWATASSGGGSSGAFYAELTYAGTANCNWQVTNNSGFTDAPAQASCPAAVVTQGAAYTTGTAGAVGNGSPAIVMPTMPAGTYRVIAYSRMQGDSATKPCYMRLSDGSNFGGGTGVANASAEQVIIADYHFTYSATASVTFKIQVGGGAGSCYMSNDQTLGEFRITVYKL